MTSPLISGRRQNILHQRPQADSYQTNQVTLTNGSSRTAPFTTTECNSTNPFTSLEYQIKQSYQNSATSLPPDGRSGHASRYAAFHNSLSSNASHQRDSSLPYTYQSTTEKHASYNNQSLGASERNSISPPATNVRGFSPFRAYQYNHLQDGDIRYASPIHSQQKFGDGESTDSTSPYQQRRIGSENRWQSPGGSPLPLRSQIQSSQEHIYGNTSPIVLQRFYHQQKQQQKVQEAEEAAKEDPGKIKVFCSLLC